MNRNVLIIISLVIVSLSAIVLDSCSNPDKRKQLFAESWNSKCPIPLVKDEINLEGLSFSNGQFVLSLYLTDNAPTTISSLRQLNEEYDNRLEAVGEYNQNLDIIGSFIFTRGIVCNSAVISQIIDSISTLAYTPESTHGFLPLVIDISDGTDKLQYQYSEDWIKPTEYEWLNAIMPVELCQWQSRGGPLPPLNDVVNVSGVPKVCNDGYLRMYCTYYASPYNTDSGLPVSIGDIREKCFSKTLLENYLSDRMFECVAARRFFNACAKRDVHVKFIVEGIKDMIDYDLSSPEQIREWESWGGSDSIIVPIPASI